MTSSFSLLEIFCWVSIFFLIHLEAEGREATMVAHRVHLFRAQSRVEKGGEYVWRHKLDIQCKL
jgi:hypothetical protein